MKGVVIIGGGLAGSEAAYQIAKRGVGVTLYEMKPQRFSPAHRLDTLAELVCSNSLKSEALNNASGLLKEEMRRLDSLIIKAAEATRVPAGKALAVDRVRFSDFITKTLEGFNNIRIVREEVTTIPYHRPLIIATGPLTSDALAAEIGRLTGTKHLYFYDAISPIVYKGSIDFNVAFKASRYGKGGDDYINCPVTEEGYYHFVDELRKAEKVPLRDFEKIPYFEGCIPIEVMAERGRETLAFGPMRPVGLLDPRTGRQSFAVAQLRRENLEDTLYSMVGFQTRLTYPEQKRVFRLIPGLEKAEFVRFGSIHRNTFIDSPRLLLKTLQFKRDAMLFFAGQIAGVEGYTESSATGLLAGVNAARLMMGEALVSPPGTTMLGALLAYITNPGNICFQPMNANLGLLPPVREKTRRVDKKAIIARRALEGMEGWERSCRLNLYG